MWMGRRKRSNQGNGVGFRSNASRILARVNEHSGEGRKKEEPVHLIGMKLCILNRCTSTRVFVRGHVRVNVHFCFSLDGGWCLSAGNSVLTVSCSKCTARQVIWELQMHKPSRPKKSNPQDTKSNQEQRSSLCWRLRCAVCCDRQSHKPATSKRKECSRHHSFIYVLALQVTG